MARLSILERPEDDVVILDLSGDIIFGETKTLRLTIRDLIRKGKSKIWLNLKDVHYVDSSGIGELISAQTAISREEDGRLKLLDPTERLQQLLEISRLLNVFDIEYNDNRAAGN